MPPRALPLLLLPILFLLAAAPERATAAGEGLRQSIEALSSFPSRVTGSAGYQAAAVLIDKRLRSLGLSPQRLSYQLPVRQAGEAWLRLQGRQYPLTPFFNNVISPGGSDGVINGPLHFINRGEGADLDGKALAGSVVLMYFDSGRNWQLAASLGARAVLFIADDSADNRSFFLEKQELTPLQLPCFWLSRDEALAIFGPLPEGREKDLQPLAPLVELQATVAWENRQADNIYALIPGIDPELQGELLVVESFFDNQAFLAERAPGADAASGIATLLELADSLSRTPPKRSVLLLATSGQAQSLAGMREAIWSINSRPKELRQQAKGLQSSIALADHYLACLQELRFPLATDPARDTVLAEAIRLPLSREVDDISRRLIALRLGKQEQAVQARIKEVARERLLARSLGWLERFDSLSPREEALLQTIIPEAIAHHQQARAEAVGQHRDIDSAIAFAETVAAYQPAAVVSLHLSSHGNGIGAFNQGWLYNLRKTINRTAIYSPVAEVLAAAGGEAVGRAAYQDSLRPSYRRAWDSWFLDRPALGGEVSALAGYLGLSLVTTGDGRGRWGTPADTVSAIDWDYLADQARLLERLVRGLGDAPRLHGGKLPRDGFATVTARTNLLLQGELFATYPAAGSTILAYQGSSRFHAMVDAAGYFQIKGIADRKHVLDKLVLEGYRFDEQSGRAIWAIDKKLTGKESYRLRPLRKNLQTDLVMFHCRETTLFDLLEPRNLRHLTRLNLFDGRRDATPEHYWFSRIDTRESILTSIYTEPGTLLKVTLSDTVLTNKLVLTNGSPERPLGLGYPVNSYQVLSNTSHHAARDAWTLLTPRIEHLERHGIYDARISALQERGRAALAAADQAQQELRHTAARAAAGEALALAARVYSQVEKTQKDVLFGVLFYIALFIPFAFVMERFLFNFVNIYKRIVAFIVILAVQIAIIYQAHPAFALAYSPMVVILAFFIIGLSLLVTLIIFFRFEEEMVLLQRRSSHQRPEEMSRWKAFSAAFFLGVSNLRRRRLRTILTATTLIILTFTIMSFTTIKSNNQQVRLPFQENAPYQGLLLKKMNWQSLPPQAASILANASGTVRHAAPRVWLEGADPSRPVSVPLAHGRNQLQINGLIGLSPDEAKVTGFDRMLASGRWFNDDDLQAIILEEQTAGRLAVAVGGAITLWGSPFRVVGTFRAETLEKTVDLDGEPLTPVIFPEEAGSERSEEEMEALEAGADLLSFQGRSNHVPAGQTAIIPARTLLAAGGKLKGIALGVGEGADIATLAGQLSDRFSLAIFTGERDGVWLYNLSDTSSYSGVPNIIIPLLISVLIVLNTMISSVYERKGEIAVYTSVGLAPSHVSFLFVAEALALGVVSVVLGYLVAQVSAALLADTPLWAGITVNYSSTAGVAAMLLVVGVVLLSVLYPARVAARIAMPDVNRTFALPPPQGNRIMVTLPFLMKFREHGSIGGFLHNYLASHQDISHGIFSTGPVEVVFSCSTREEIIGMVAESTTPHDLRCLHLRTRVWLAPFDFGIMQTVDIHFSPAREGNEFLEIHLSLQREAGEAGMWQRINTTFLHELRKQLLIWRSLDEKGHTALQQDFVQRLAADTGGTTAALGGGLK